MLKIMKTSNQTLIATPADRLEDDAIVPGVAPSMPDEEFAYEFECCIYEAEKCGPNHQASVDLEDRLRGAKDVVP